MRKKKPSEATVETLSIAMVMLIGESITATIKDTEHINEVSEDKLRSFLGTTMEFMRAYQAAIIPAPTSTKTMEIPVACLALLDAAIQTSINDTETPVGDAKESAEDMLKRLGYTKDG